MEAPENNLGFTKCQNAVPVSGNATVNFWFRLEFCKFADLPFCRSCGKRPIALKLVPKGYGKKIY